MGKLRKEVAEAAEDYTSEQHASWAKTLGIPQEVASAILNDIRKSSKDNIAAWFKEVPAANQHKLKECLRKAREDPAEAVRAKAEACFTSALLDGSLEKILE